MGQCVCQGVFAARLGGGGQPEQAFAVAPFEGEDIHHARLAFGDGPRLVEDDRLDPVHPLEGRGFADEQAGAGASAGGDGHGHRRGQAQGAGAGDDQDGRRVQDASAPVVTDQPPAEDRQEGDPEDRRDEPRRNRVGEPLDLGLGTLGVADQPDDPLQGTLAAQATGLDQQRTIAVACRPGDAVAEPLGHRFRLAGEHRLVDARLPLDDLAVDGDGLAGPDADNLAGADLGQRDLDFQAIPDDLRRLGGEVEQPLDRRARRPFRADLEELAQRDQGQDDPGVHEEVGLVGVAEQELDHAIAVGRRGPQGDQRVHVRRALLQAIPGPSAVRSAQVNLQHAREHEHRPADRSRVPRCRRGEQGGIAEDDQGHGQAHPDDQSFSPVIDLLRPFATERLGPFAHDQLGPPGGVAGTGDGVGNLRLGDL